MKLPVVLLLLTAGIFAAVVLGISATRPNSASAADYSAVTAGGRHTCALTTGAGVQCWGWNGEGELGDGTTTQRTRPIAVSGLSSGVTAVSAGEKHTCAVTSTGGVKCWGNNVHGELGDGTTTSSSTPVVVCASGSGGTCSALSSVASVASGDGHTCALTTSGGVKCWGWNRNGQLGNGTTTNASNPVDVSGLTTGVAAIATGGEHSCALTTAGAAKCWGTNSSGEVGNGSYSDYVSSPAAVSGLTSGAASIDAGDMHTCAVTTTGGAKCWGDNGTGQLGDGTDAGKLTPAVVCASGSGAGCSALANVAKISAGGSHTCAKLTSGALKCWGYDGFGQLGRGNSDPLVSDNLPGNVQGLTAGAGEPLAGAVAAGSVHTCTITTAGVIKCWGWNGSGQLGDGTTTDNPLATNRDFDRDGCQDERELGPTPALGGQRNPKSFWDFFDTPDTNNVRDKIITQADKDRVIARYGQDGDPTIDPLSAPPATGYHTAFDRGGKVGANLWNQAPPNGQIRTADISAVNSQLNHSCQ